METLQPIPPQIANLANHETAAHQALDDNAWAYFSDGAADELTLQANVAAWQALRLLPRVLTPLARGHTLHHPILVAPVHRCMTDPDQGSSPLWFQLYLQPQRDTTLALLARAEAAGYSATLAGAGHAAAGADQRHSSPRRRPPGAGLRRSGRDRVQPR